MYRDDILRLAHQLASESEPAMRQRLTRRLKREIDELEAAEVKTITPRQAYNGNYWKARAARLRRASCLYESQVIHDYFMEIAAGYENLAERAYKIRKGPIAARSQFRQSEHYASVSSTTYCQPLPSNSTFTG
jgi:hypothetical protein